MFLTHSIQMDLTFVHGGFRIENFKRISY